MDGLIFILLLLPIIILIILIIKHCIKSYISIPFNYPHITVHFDISRKRQPNYNDYVEEWLIKQPNHYKNLVTEYNSTISKWEKTCTSYLQNCLFWKSHREEQYDSIRRKVLSDEYKMFEFIFIRKQTRYRQVNYQKQSYTVNNEEKILEYTLSDIIEIDKKLKNINYETTMSKWTNQNQRSLMTKALKSFVKKRDNYTCQMCGKYMPDEVGLHIDHIIPIKKGGKSVATNLQVLCDKCNLKKGKK